MSRVTRWVYSLLEACDVLRAGGLLAFPTETVYGLGADGLDSSAVRRVFAAKERPLDNPLILHVADVESAKAVAVWNAHAARLAVRHWPGPLTLVLWARPDVPTEVRAGLRSVAVRCPQHPLAQALIRGFGRPIAAPSANRAGRPSPTTAEAAWGELAGRIDAVLDGGPCGLGLESTVVDCTGAELRLLRPGAVSAEILGVSTGLPLGDYPASPGTRYRHYAPAVPLYLVADVAAALAQRPGAGLLCTEACARNLGVTAGERIHIWGADAERRAAEFYAALRRLERAPVSCIVAERLPEQGLDAVIMDRLRRASQSLCPGEE